MKQLIFISLASTLLFACNGAHKSDTSGTAEISHKEWYGSWVGAFTLARQEDGIEEVIVPPHDKINLVIKKISTDSIFGESILKGIKKPIVGVFKENKGKFIFTLKQNEKDTLGGIFEFSIRNDSLIGTWKPYDSLSYKMGYTLLKKKHIYNASSMLVGEGGYIDWENGKEENSREVYRQSSPAVFKLNASTTVLNEKELKNLRKLDLELIRNCIYARHGLIFTDKKAWQFFDYVDWYIPLKDNVDNELLC